MQRTWLCCSGFIYVYCFISRSKYVEKFPYLCVDLIYNAIDCDSYIDLDEIQELLKTTCVTLMEQVIFKMKSHCSVLSL